MKVEHLIKRPEIKPVKNEDRVIVMALRFNSHGTQVQIEPTMRRIQHMISIQMHREMELAGFAFTSGDNIVSENGDLTLEDLLNSDNQ
jgi:hypothetical protein